RDWRSDVCSSDLPGAGEGLLLDEQFLPRRTPLGARDDLRKRHGSSCATVPLQEVTAGVTGTHRWGREILAAPGGRGGAGRGQGAAKSSPAAATAAVRDSGQGRIPAMTVSTSRSPARVSSCFSLVTHSPRSASTACPVCRAAVATAPATSVRRPWGAWFEAA